MALQIAFYQPLNNTHKQTLGCAKYSQIQCACWFSFLTHLSSYLLKRSNKYKID